MQDRMTSRYKYLLTLIALLLMAGSATFFFQHRSREYASEQFLMDTLVSIRVYGREPAVMQAAVADAFAVMRKVADLADHFPQAGSEDCRRSDVCRINAAAGISPVRVENETLEMLEWAKRYHSLTDRAFDVTVGPVMKLWGFGGDHPHRPPAEKIAAALTLVDDSLLEVNAAQQTVFLKKTGMQLDLGALAKGYATEKALLALKVAGVEKALIDAGGNIRVLGKTIHEAPWRIGIKDPRKDAAMIAVVSLEDEAAVTSGDYYRYFEEGTKRYHHILDPRSGYPAAENMSVTVIAKDAGLADILSTAFFIQPPEKALALAQQLDVDLLLVSADGRILHTPDLHGRIEVTAQGQYRYDPR